MKMPAVACALAVVTSCPVFADPPKEVMNIVREADIKFQPARYPGIQSAIISGNPATPGQAYVQRNKFSPGTFSPPHFHPETRYVVVLKGTWWVGSGPKWDKENTTPVPAGSFVVHHANQIHYDGAKDEEVAHRLRAALEHVPPERLVAAPDCGMKYLSRAAAFGKLQALARGASLVRGELA